MTASHINLIHKILNAVENMDSLVKANKLWLLIKYNQSTESFTLTFRKLVNVADDIQNTHYNKLLGGGKALLE